VTGETGMLYEPHEPEALIIALQRCAASDLQRMGRLALGRVQELSWQVMAAQTLAAYRRQ
jgi:glycosyltransferase involved in cell wall biosynthesis